MCKVTPLSWSRTERYSVLDFHKGAAHLAQGWNVAHNMTCSWSQPQIDLRIYHEIILDYKVVLLLCLSSLLHSLVFVKEFALHFFSLLSYPPWGPSLLHRFQRSLSVLSSLSHPSHGNQFFIFLYYITSYHVSKAGCHFSLNFFETWFHSRALTYAVKRKKKRSSVIPDGEFLPNLIRSCPSSIIFLRVPNPGVSSFHFRLIL